LITSQINTNMIQLVHLLLLIHRKTYSSMKETNHLWRKNIRKGYLAPNIKVDQRKRFITLIKTRKTLLPIFASGLYLWVWVVVEWTSLGSRHLQQKVWCTSTCGGIQQPSLVALVPLWTRARIGLKFYWSKSLQIRNSDINLKDIISECNYW